MAGRAGMTLQVILEPVRLGLRLRIAGIARQDAGRTEERIALLGLASLVVLVASALVHARLLVAGSRQCSVGSPICATRFSASGARSPWRSSVPLP